MKVAQVIFTGSYAGAENVACLLTEALKPHVERSLLYLIVESRAGEAACKALAERVAAHPIEVHRLATQARFSKALYRDLHASLKQHELDVVHCHSYKAAFYFGTLRRLRRIASPVVFTLHGMDQARWHHYLYIQSYNYLGALLADKVVACSSPMAASYEKFPGLKRKLSTIRNGIAVTAPVDADARRLARQMISTRLGIPPDGVWLAIIGRLVEVKNHELLLNAFAALAAALPEARLLVIGQGPLEQQLRDQTAALRLSDSVLFTGYIGDMARWYPALDMVVLSSTTEGTPMAVLEAGNYGIPVVASAVGGIPDMVDDGTTGVLFPSGDQASLAAALARLAEDAALRARLGAAAREWVAARFSAGAWGREHAALYESLLAAKTAYR